MASGYTINFRATLQSLPTVLPKGSSDVTCTFYYDGTQIPMEPLGLDHLPKIICYNRGLLDTIADAGAFPSSLPAPLWKSTASEVQNDPGNWKATLVIDVPHNSIITVFWFFEDNLSKNTITYEQHYRAGSPDDFEIPEGNAAMVQDVHFSDTNLWNTSVGIVDGSGSMESMPGRLFSILGGAFDTLEMVGGNSLFLLGSKVLGLESIARGVLHNQVQFEKISSDVANLANVRGRIEDSQIGRMLVKGDSALNTSNLKVESLNCSKSNLRMSTGSIDNMQQINSSQLNVSEGTIKGQPTIISSNTNFAESDLDGDTVVIDSKVNVTGGSIKGELLMSNSYYEAIGVDFGE